MPHFDKDSHFLAILLLFPCCHVLCVCVYLCLAVAGRQMSDNILTYSSAVCLWLKDIPFVCIHTCMHTDTHWSFFQVPLGLIGSSCLVQRHYSALLTIATKKRKHCLCPWSKTSQWHLRKSLDNFKSSHALTHLSPATEETPFLVLHRKFLNALKPTNEKNRKDVVKVSLLYARHKVTVHRRDYVSLRWFIKK